MKNLIIGAGEVGTALRIIFSTKHETLLADIDPPYYEGVKILHIAFPDSHQFVNQVVEYVGEYKPDLTVIHSSIAIGTTDKCGEHVVHSPIRGRHPNLAKEMRVYPKFVGGSDMDDIYTAAEFFESVNWPTIVCDDAKMTECLKLLSNAHMALEVAWRQEVDRVLGNFCGNLDYLDETYRRWEGSYYDGYKRLNQAQLMRPRLSADPIGGHCLLECVKLLNSQFGSKAFDFILESNEKAKEATACQSPR